MPSQDSTAGIRLAHAPDGIGYRLLELPPDLATEGTDPWTIESDASGLARLRTAEGKVYVLQQKNTSNALMLLSACRLPSGAGSGSDSAMVPGLAAVATLHETVDLVEEKEAPKAPAAKPAAAAAAASSAAAVKPARGKWHERFGKTR